jgi:hypothetical protein
MEFIRKEAILPVPFNLFPTPVLVLKIINKVRSCSFKRKENSNGGINFNEMEMPKLKRNGEAAMENDANVSFYTHQRLKLLWMLSYFFLI